MWVLYLIKNMIWVLNYIKEKFPSAWLSNIGNNELDEFEETGVIIKHPLNDSFKLDIVIMKERVGIAVLYKNEEDILIDLGRFDYSFEHNEGDELKSFLDSFLLEGKIPNL